MATSAIYAITNTLNNKMYIGSSVSCEKRWNEHRRSLASGKHHSRYLQSSYKKYGKENFDFSIIEFVDDRDSLTKREQVWIDFFKPKYNGRPIANSPLGTKHTEQTKLKMSAAHKGKIFSKNHCANISKAKKGKSISDAQKILISNSLKGHNPTDETRKKLSASLIGNKRAAGKKYSLEERIRISENMKKIWAQRKLKKDIENV